MTADEIRVSREKVEAADGKDEIFYRNHTAFALYEIAAQLAEENEIGREVASLRSEESKALIGKLQSERDYWQQQAKLSKDEASSTRDLIALVGKFQSVAAEQVQAINDSTAVNAKTLAILERNSKVATES